MSMVLCMCSNQFAYICMYVYIYVCIYIYIYIYIYNTTACIYCNISAYLHRLPSSDSESVSSILPDTTEICFHTHSQQQQNTGQTTQVRLRFRHRIISPCPTRLLCIISLSQKHSTSEILFLLTCRCVDLLEYVMCVHACVKIWSAAHANFYFSWHAGV